MSRKLSDYDEKASNKIRESIINSANLIGIDEYEGSCGNVSNGLTSNFGLCSDCTHFSFCASEFRVRVAKCSLNNVGLYDHDPIRTCTDYLKRGQMTLSMMFDMALMLEVDKKIVGF